MGCPPATSPYPLTRKSYVTLMKTISLTIADLTPATGEKKFCNIIRSLDPFAMMYTDELNKALNNQLKGPAIVVESYEARYDNNNSSNMIKDYDAAFIIVGKQLKNDNDQLLDLIDSLEIIGETFLNKLFIEFQTRFDTNASGVLRYQGCESGIVGPIADNWWGQRFVFSFKMGANRKFNN